MPKNKKKNPKTPSQESPSLGLNETRCNEMLSSILEIFQKHQPTVGEILLIYGNLGYSLGASIGGFDGKGPGIDELKQLYYQQPGRLDVALMLEGLTVTTWYEDYEKQTLDKLKNGDRENTQEEGKK
jgi:hypothetical protein